MDNVGEDDSSAPTSSQPPAAANIRVAVRVRPENERELAAMYK